MHVVSAVPEAQPHLRPALGQSERIANRLSITLQAKASYLTSKASFIALVDLRDLSRSSANLELVDLTRSTCSFAPSTTARL